MSARAERALPYKSCGFFHWRLEGSVKEQFRTEQAGKIIMPAGAIDQDLLRVGAAEKDLGHVRPTGLASRCIFGSWDLQPVRTTHLPSLQDNMSCAGGTLLGFSQWEGEKEGRPFGSARRMNAATQTAGQLADDR
jgi:hypothetical protein